MDFNNKIITLVFLMACANCVPGVRLPKPDNLQVNILDEEVIVHWDKPSDAPSDVHYNVQFARYAGDWTAVDECTNITRAFCELSDLIEDFETAYKVRVQLEASDAHSEWAGKKILPNSSELQPPSFSMWATSSTVTVHVHQKPILRKLFPFGITYTIYLEEKGQNKTTITSLKDDIWEDQNEKTFTSLKWGKEYCVTVKVEGNGGVSTSLSPQMCRVLPEQEWIITSVVSLTVSGLLIIAGFIATFILCYIRGSAKTPPALKSPAAEWRPLSFAEVPVEVVTDKGWFLFKAETEFSGTFKNLPTADVADEQSGEEDRRPSTDSGLSMNLPSSSDPTGREDSGCGSIGTEASVCSNFQIQDEGRDALCSGKTDDSGMGLSCHSDASSLNLEEQDSGCLNKSGEYHSQKLLTVCVHDSDNEDIFKEKLPEPQLVSAVSGYRTNAPLCTCSGANLCVWCHNQSNCRGKYKGLLQKNNIMESYSSYLSNNQMNIMSKTETNLLLAQMEKTFPLLTSLSSCPLMEKGRDLNMNDVSISLCDIELNSY